MPEKTLKDYLAKIATEDEYEAILRFIRNINPCIIVNPKEFPVETRRHPFLYGTPKLVLANNIADNTKPVDLRPASGKRYFIMGAWGYHDDGAANRDSKWQFYDGTDTMETIVQSVALNTLCDIREFVNPSSPASATIFPIVLSRDVYARFSVASLGSGKYAYVQALVLEMDE